MVKNSNRSLEILENVSGKTYSIYDHFYAILLVFFNYVQQRPWDMLCFFDTEENL